MKSKIFLVGILFIYMNTWSIEKSDFFLGAGFRIISPDIAQYAAHPFFMKTGYIHDIPNTKFNLGFEGQFGFGGRATESGDNEFIAFWKLQINSRYDFEIPNKKFIPYLNLALGLFNAGFQNDKDRDALAIDQDGYYEAETKYFGGIGGGILIVLSNEDKINLSLDYDYSHIDYKLAPGNPLGVGISVNYLF